MTALCDLADELINLRYAFGLSQADIDAAAGKSKGWCAAFEAATPNNPGLRDQNMGVWPD